MRQWELYSYIYIFVHLHFLANHIHNNDDADKDEKDDDNDVDEQYTWFGACLLHLLYLLFKCSWPLAAKLSCTHSHMHTRSISCCSIFLPTLPDVYLSCQALFKAVMNCSLIHSVSTIVLFHKTYNNNSNKLYCLPTYLLGHSLF